MNLSPTGGPALAPPQELVAYLEGLPEPHILFDRDYRIAAANAAYRRQFGQQFGQQSGAGESVLGRRCHEVSHHIDVPCDQAGERCPLADALVSGQRERVLHLHHTPQGEAHVDIELVPLAGPDGRPRWFIEKMQPLRVAVGEPAAAGLIGRSPAFLAMLSLVARVAPSQASVLLLGESGTGKELVSRAVHEASPRASAPLVVVDCASLPESLFESELFGHERGAFTGAHAAHAGLVQAAAGGTLFLDEVGDIPLPMQVKLLRLLETGTWRRVGSTELRHADLRWVAATHRDLPAMVAQGRFREDLFHRLATFPIRLPALRERRDDIPLLAAALLTRLARPGGQPPPLLTPAALARLQGHDFPGNVRELRNVLERALLLGDGGLLGAELIEAALALGRVASAAASPPPHAAPLSLPPSSPPPGPGIGWRQAERQAQHAALRAALRAALAAHPGRREDQARALGISLRTLHRRLRDLQPPPEVQLLPEGQAPA